MKVIKNIKGKEVKIFAETFENEAFEQIKRLANFEAYQDETIRVMPDAHSGKGCTIGTTMTLSDKVTPNLVGVDIGCGMLTVKLGREEIDFEKLDMVIRNYIPSGFDVHDSPVETFNFSDLRCKNHVDLGRAALSLGSLGGGNHFIEVGKSNLGDFYLVIHSGSRKLGGDTCKYYQDKAFKNFGGTAATKKELVKKLKAEGRAKDIQAELSKIKKPSINKELAYLSGKDFSDYAHDMRIVQRFASLNRETMARIIVKEAKLSNESRFETIHNYIDFNRMILRKGAVSAEKDELLLIPINMRDGSLVCIGLGNADWNYSAPHGAGRLMSRSKAKETIPMEEYKKLMKEVYTTSVNIHTLDEAPQAYKPIEEIMTTIIETARVIDVIKPVYNFKAS